MSNITIYTAVGAVRFSTPINAGSRRKVELMKDDYITLKFSVSSPISFAIGDYCDVSMGNNNAAVNGRYVITQLQNPTYNKSTGGYDYELKMDADYMRFKNRMVWYMPSNGRNESSFSLTALPSEHLNILIANISELGYTYTYNITCDKASERKLITYSGTNIIDALSSIAEAWETEWYIEGTVIYLGKCDLGNDVSNLEIGSELEEMTSSDSKNNYATRLYAFGSENNIPSNYRTATDSSEQAVYVNSVVQKRLMLPESTPYIQIDDELNEAEIVEAIIVFDDIKPTTTQKVTSIETYTQEIKNDQGDGTGEYETFYLCHYNHTAFPFYAIEGDDEHDYRISGKSLTMTFRSGSLNGMTFDVNWHNTGDIVGNITLTSPCFEIIASENYGVKLPNTTYAPKVNDTFNLDGWDASKIASLNLIATAEQNLLTEANKYASNLATDPHTYTCKCMSDWAYGLDNEGNLDNAYWHQLQLGERVRLINDAYFDEGYRDSRVIGYEMNLDIPYDSPIYIVGESSSYSRIGDLQSQIDEIQMNGNTYAQISSGNGASIYVIKSSDSTSATDRNVFSAKRALNQFLRRDIDESTEHNLSAKHITASNGATINGNASIGSATVTNGITAKELTVNTNYGISSSGIARTSQVRVGDDYGIDASGNTTTRIIRSLRYTGTSLTGAGYSVFPEVVSGSTLSDWHFVIDKLTVRKYMTVLELIISKIRSVGGQLLISVANGKIKSVTKSGNNYTIVLEDSSEFVANDLIRCQTWTGSNIKSYWVRLTSVNTNGSLVVSATDSGWNGYTPEAGDEIIQMGNTSNSSRQGCILLDARGSQPTIDIINDIISASTTTGNIRARLGYLGGLSLTPFGQMQGYGLYCDNAYISGTFVLRSSGKTVDTAISDSEASITTAYTNAITANAQSLRSEYSTAITNSETRTRTAYTSMINQTAQNLQLQVDSIKNEGNVNMFRNTSFVEKEGDNYSYWLHANYTDVIQHNGYNYLHAYNTPNNSSVTQRLSFEAGEDYSVSIYFKGKSKGTSAAKTIKLIFDGDAQGFEYNHISYDDILDCVVELYDVGYDWYRLEATIYNIQDSGTFEVGFMWGYGLEIWYGQLQCEKGDEVTEWKPNQLDGSASTEWVTSQLNIRDGEIITQVDSKISASEANNKEYADGILESSKAYTVTTKGEILSSVSSTYATKSGMQTLESKVDAKADSYDITLLRNGLETTGIHLSDNKIKLNAANTEIDGNLELKGTLTEYTIGSTTELDANTIACCAGHVEDARYFQIIDISKNGSIRLPYNYDGEYATFSDQNKLIFLPAYVSRTIYNPDVNDDMNEYIIPAYKVSGTHLTISVGNPIASMSKWAYTKDSAYRNYWQASTQYRNEIRAIYNSAVMVCADALIYADDTHTPTGRYYYDNGEYMHGRFSIGGATARMILVMPGQTLHLISQIESINGVNCLVWCVQNADDFPPIDAYFSTNNGTNVAKWFSGEAEYWNPAMVGNPDNWEDVLCAHPKLDCSILGTSPQMYINLNRNHPDWSFNYK